jgi:hypothetical protein
LFFSTFACMRMTSKPVIPRNVFEARFIPSCTAASNDVDDDATISVTRATAMLLSFLFPPGNRLGSRLALHRLVRIRRAMRALANTPALRNEMVDRFPIREKLRRRSGATTTRSCEARLWSQGCKSQRRTPEEAYGVE